MKFDSREDIIQLTPQWEGERFADGRPRVPDVTLAKMRALNMVLEEAWSVCRRAGFDRQFEGNWLNQHPERIIVGRAVTGVFVPHRPDLHDTLMELGNEKEGRIGAMNSWVIETLEKDDVPVIDLFGKVLYGTYSGANLATAIATRTGVGQVINGGIRDAQQIIEIPDFNTFVKGMDPTPIRDVTLIGMNVPCRIGNAICMPGDIVLGTLEGVLFIPPQLADEVVEHSIRTHMREMFSHQRLREGIYNSSQMDTKWTDEINADFDVWRETHKLEGIEDVDWSKETAAEAQQADEETLV